MIMTDVDVEGYSFTFELTQIGRHKLVFIVDSEDKKTQLKKEIEGLILSFLNDKYKRYVEKEKGLNYISPFPSP